MNKKEAANLRWKSDAYRQKVINGLKNYYLKLKKPTEFISCECGCGILISKYDCRRIIRRFLKGHASRVKTYEWRQKLSLASKKDWEKNYELKMKGIRKTAEKLRGKSWGKQSEYQKKKASQIHKGKKINNETRMKMRNSRLIYAKNNPDKEKERGKKVGNILRGRTQSKKVVEAIKEKWKNPKFKEARLKQMLKFKSPNRPENKMIEIIEKNNLPFKFTGNGSFILGGFNPDFVDCNDKKLIIEVFGDYWHNRPDWKERDAIRLKEFESLGYKTLVFWEHEIVKRKEVKNSPTLTEKQIVKMINSG